MSNVGLENQDDRSCELECSSASTVSDHHRIALKPENTQHMPLEGSKATLEVEKLSHSEDSVGETNEKSQASAKIEGAAVVPTSSGKSANPTATSACPAGLGHAAPLLEPAPRVVQQLRMNGHYLQRKTNSLRTQ